MALSTQPYKGARDFYPEDKRLQKYIFLVMRQVSESFGYEEYDAPILEPLELFLAKTGQEIVSEQTYSFEDRGGRQVAIRPEMTPSVSRMVAAKRQELAYPLRWYSIPNFWRYERPQRGRQREFWQLNVDLFGIKGLDAELEIIQIADRVMKAFGATHDMYTIRLNSRKLVDLILGEYLGLSETQVHSISKLIDRMPKMEQPAFVAEIDALFTPGQREQGLSEHLLELLKAKELEDLPKSVQSQKPAEELSGLLKLLKHVGIPNAKFDISLMRGLDYYTDIVFEVFDNSPENNRSMFGGGRYDGLIALFGAEPLASVGFAMGDVTMQAFMTVHDLLPSLKPETDLYVVLIGDVVEQAQPVIADLREMGLNVAVDFSGRKTDAQIKTAVKKGLPYVLFIGDKELEKQQYTLKKLQTGTEERHSPQRIVSIVKDYRKK